MTILFTRSVTICKWHGSVWQYTTIVSRWQILCRHSLKDIYLNISLIDFLPCSTLWCLQNCFRYCQYSPTHFLLLLVSWFLFIWVVGSPVFVVSPSLKSRVWFLVGTVLKSKFCILFRIWLFVILSHTSATITYFVIRAA